MIPGGPHLSDQWQLWEKKHKEEDTVSPLVSPTPGPLSYRELPLQSLNCRSQFVDAAAQSHPNGCSGTLELWDPGDTLSTKNIGVRITDLSLTPILPFTIMTLEVT